MTLVRCPTCDKPFDPTASGAMPFCSDRCQRADLHRWLNEQISIPVDDTSDEAPQRWPDEPGDE